MTKAIVWLPLAAIVLMTTAVAFGLEASQPTTASEKPRVPCSNNTTMRPRAGDFAILSQCRFLLMLPRESQRPTPDSGDGFAQAQSPSEAPAQTGGAEALAKQVANPIASLISVRFENNFDFNTGPEDDGYRYTMNFQPVIPIALNKNWNVISRTILPLIHQDDIVGRSSQTGLGDVVQSLFFSPNKTQPFIWGAGPVLLIPTATDGSLGTRKFGLGPTAVALKQQGHWTYGGLWNHIWSVAGDDDRDNVNSTFIQPFIAYTTKTAWTYLLNTESSYDWKGNAWSVPIHLVATKVVKVGTRPVSIGGGVRCWVKSPAGGPQGCGFRFLVIPLFPKG